MAPLQFELTAERRHQFNFGASQIDGGGGNEQILHVGGLYAVLQRVVSHDDVVHRALEVPGIDAQARGGISLRVKINDQDPEVELGQRGAQIDGCGRLSHTALLVGHGQ